MKQSDVAPIPYQIPLPQSKTDSIAIKNDYLKFIYAAMLLEFSHSEVRQFWDKHSFPYAGDPPDLSILYKWLWQEDAYSDLEFFVRVTESVEPFLLSKGKYAPDFIRNALHKLNGGLVIPSKSMIKWTNPVMELFFQTDDLRHLILQLIPHYTSILAPGLHHRLAEYTVDEKNGSADATIVLIASIGDPLNSTGSRKILPPFDCELWVTMIVQTIPQSMHLKPFENFSIIADTRPVHSIVPDAVYRNGKYFIEGTEIGSEISFNTFCKNRSISSILEDGRIPDITVAEITNDHFCPARKRIVLHKGCAYGSPACLYNFKFNTKVKKPKGFFTSIIEESTSNTNRFWLKVQDKHNELLGNIEPTANFVYHVRDESVSVNGKHLVKSVPAKMLRYILKQYSKNQQCEFEYREFINNPDIVLNTLAPNMAVRLSRLAKALDEGFPSLKIIRTERGKFSIKALCRLSYVEKQD